MMVSVCSIGYTLKGRREMAKQRGNRTVLFCVSSLMCATLIVSTLVLRFPLPGTDLLITAQLLFALLSGLVLPLVYSLLSIIGYIFLGLIGLPVFSAASGPAIVFTPNFCFLLGFLAAVTVEFFLCKMLKDKKNCDFLAALSGTFAMYVVALPCIALQNRVLLQSPIGITELMLGYCAIFLPFDLLKAYLASLIAPRLRKAIHL